MRVQSVNNYAVTAKNYQTDENSRQSKMLNQPLFGKVIIDERGIEKKFKKEGAGGIVIRVFKSIKDSIENSAALVELKTSLKHDILIYPLKTNPDLAGIGIVKPDENGSLTSFYFWNKENNFSKTYILDFIKKLFPEAGVFARLNRDESFDYFWQIDKPLPKKVLDMRFGINNK